MKRAILALLLVGGCYARFDAVAELDAPRPYVEDTRPDVPPFDGGGAPAVCGGTTCGAGQICCLLDGRCIDVGDPSCVATEPGACASHADCPGGTLCRRGRAEGALPSLCGGPGRCEVVSGPGACGERPSAVCGCDGRTYPSACDAFASGVLVAALSSCGIGWGAGVTQECVTPGEDLPSCGEHGTCDAATMRCLWEDLNVPCGGNDAFCPSGQVCCAITGHCHDPAVLGTCALPPEGTTFPCASDDDCARIDGSWWPMGLRATFCDAPSCGGPGGCRPLPATCDGSLLPVCGCDGTTYHNACEAHRSAVRIAHEGACP